MSESPSDEPIEPTRPDYLELKVAAAALEASDQITAAVARRTTPDESPAPAEPTVDA